MHSFALFGFVPAWLAGLGSALAAVPFGAWLTLAGVATAGGVKLWMDRRKLPAKQKVKELLSTADTIDNFVIGPLRIIAPMTRTTADDKFLAFAVRSVEEMRAQAALAGSFPAARAANKVAVPSAIEVSAKVLDEVQPGSGHKLATPKLSITGGR